MVRFTHSRYLHFALVLYFVLAAVLFFIAGRQIDADMLSYIGVAEKYADGDFSDAINGFWGPLISWLLLPVLVSGIEPLLAVRILVLIIGGVTIVAIRLLSERFEMSKQIRDILLFLSIPIILSFAGKNVGADLLLTCLLLFYFYLIFDPDYAEKRRSAFFCGLLGGFAYLTKGFGFHFFIIHFMLFTFLHYKASIEPIRKRKVMGNALVGLGVFVLLSAPWIFTISAKYGRPMISPTGAYNFAVVANPNNIDHPMAFNGLQQPPHPSAINIWEDPTYLEVEPWSPLQSLGALKYELKLIWQNWGQIIRFANEFSLFATTIFVGFILFSIVPIRNLLRVNMHYPLLTAILYLFGYSLIQVQRRYIWVALILFFLMGGTVLHRLFLNDFFSGIRKKIVLALFCLSFILPVSENLLRLNNSDAYATYIRNTAKKLREIGVAGQIASHPQENNRWLRTPLQSYWSAWHDTFFLCFFMDSPYFGTPKPESTEQEVMQELKKNEIDYYFVWGEEVIPFLNDYVEKTGGSVPNLRVFAMRERKDGSQT